VITQSLYEGLDQAFNYFPNYCMKIMLGDGNEKLGREDIFRPTIGNERLYQDNSNNDVGIVNFATSIN
jgi:hypothetical protein